MTVDRSNRIDGRNDHPNATTARRRRLITERPMAFICEPGETRPDTAPGALHHLPATPETVHWGYFDAAKAPCLRVKSGDLIQAEAITHHAGDAPELMMDEAVQTLFREVPQADRHPGVHIMTGPIYVEDAKPGDILEVRYLRMVPRCSYGSNLAANWGYLYKEFGEKERVTIYQLDANAQHAEALYAYDFPGKYLVPGAITHCPVCDREPALKGVRVPARPHLGTAGVAPDVALKLREPEAAVGFRENGEAAVAVEVPEAAVHEHDGA